MPESEKSPTLNKLLIFTELSRCNFLTVSAEGITAIKSSKTGVPLLSTYVAAAHNDSKMRALHVLHRSIMLLKIPNWNWPWNFPILWRIHFVQIPNLICLKFMECDSFGQCISPWASGQKHTLWHPMKVLKHGRKHWLQPAVSPGKRHVKTHQLIWNVLLRCCQEMRAKSKSHCMSI